MPKPGDTVYLCQTDNKGRGPWVYVARVVCRKASWWTYANPGGDQWKENGLRWAETPRQAVRNFLRDEAGHFTPEGRLLGQIFGREEADEAVLDRMIEAGKLLGRAEKVAELEGIISDLKQDSLAYRMGYEAGLRDGAGGKG